MTFTPPPDPTTRPTLQGTFGMSASTHWLATQTAQAVLERGGNAFDASVAAGFVLHVVEPHLNGPGGDMTGLFATAEVPMPQVLMGQGPAPAGATLEHLRAEGLDMVPGAGALAAAVPGAVDAWLVLLRDHGSWDIAEVLAYAIGYAENGHPIHAGTCAAIASAAEMFRAHWPSSAEQWLPGGQVPEPGDLVRMPGYARTLRRLLVAADEARAVGDGGADSDVWVARIEAVRRQWREGFVAEEAAAFIREPHMHSSGTIHAGVLTVEDTAGFSAGYEEPVSIEFRGHTIAKTGPWGQGPVLLQTLRILDGFDDADLDPSTERGAHTILEALKLALADRDTHYGHGEVDLETLLSEEYAASRRELITDWASLDFRPGLRDKGEAGFLPPLVTSDEFELPAEAVGSDAGASVGSAAGSGEPTMQTNGTPRAVRGDTCHLDVVDRWGNIISATPSGGWLQSSPLIPALGFCLGTRLQMMWLDETSPSRLEGGKRPRTTLTPTLISRGGKPVMALGTPGGDQQDQWQLLAILRMLVGGYTPQQAIDAPAFHTTALPGSFWPRTWTPGGVVVEDRLGDEVIDGLIARGHVVSRAGNWSLGRLSCVTCDPETGILQAAANPRGMQGYAAGR
ncbi:gamma-glutamyltransferase family protein [Brevibacterium sp. UBA7493]|uniref:gamma-glutamyltransferase family protein n=1 Tax=Brevibacterium sp. UBA7493 TaxID=1946121 RepID=UPI002580B21F|nr:gamma-glutamyltransferase [Brevibacterium sp. UBA7493]